MPVCPGGSPGGGSIPPTAAAPPGDSPTVGGSPPIPLTPNSEGATTGMVGVPPGNTATTHGCILCAQAGWITGRFADYCVSENVFAMQTLLK